MDQLKTIAELEAAEELHVGLKDMRVQLLDTVTDDDGRKGTVVEVSMRNMSYLGVLLDGDKELRAFRKSELTPIPEYVVKLEYFKKSGKYYTHGVLITDKLYMFELLDDIKALRDQDKLPGIVGNEWIIYVNADKHPNGFPMLIMPQEV